ncbi:MAG: glycosyltransferase family 2 protein [Candidatus Dormibacteraceae bacterium]
MRTASVDALGGPLETDDRSEIPVTSIVIATWRRAKWLDPCLRALAGQETRPGEVLVVGRADDLEAQAVVERANLDLPFVTRWLEVDRPGHIAPLRRGLTEARGEIVVFLDDDTEAEPKWLAAFLPAFSDPRVACIGGRVVVEGFDGKVSRHAGRIRWYGKYIGNVGEREDLEPVEVASVMECNWAWRRVVLERLEFDPVLDFDDASMYGLDLCMQARKLGYRTIYQSQARVLHHVAPRDPQLDRTDRERRTLSYSRNYTYVSLKHMPGPRRIVYVAWWWLIGDRGSYGVLLALLDIIQQHRGVAGLTRASLHGKWVGLRLWRGRSVAQSPS